MAFELVEEALLQLKKNRQKEEAVEAERQRAATAATTQFAAIKSEVLGPIFSKAAALLADEGLFAEIRTRRMIQPVPSLLRSIFRWKTCLVLKAA